MTYKPKLNTFTALTVLLALLTIGCGTTKPGSDKAADNSKSEQLKPRPVKSLLYRSKFQACLTTGKGSPWKEPLRGGTGDNEWVKYECASDCTYTNELKCADCRDGHCEVAFVSDYMGGTLIWEDEPALQDAVFLHQAGTGTIYTRSVCPELVKRLEKIPKLNVVDIKWENGVLIGQEVKYSFVAKIAALITDLPAGKLPLGWASKKEQGPTDFEALSIRPALVMKWIRENLVGKKNKLATGGCSGGAVATFLPVFFHGAGEYIDYQLLGGGPTVTHIDWGCVGKDTGTKGVCTETPEKGCSNYWDCSGFTNTCSMYEWGSQPRDALAGLIDYIFNTTPDCLNSNTSNHESVNKWKMASFRYYSNGEMNPDLKVDFIANSFPFMGDDWLGAASQAGWIYKRLGPKTRKRWFTKLGPHCMSMAMIPSIPCMRICEGLGKSGCSSICNP